MASNEKQTVSEMLMRRLRHDHGVDAEIAHNPYHNVVVMESKNFRLFQKETLILFKKRSFFSLKKSIHLSLNIQNKNIHNFGTSFTLNYSKTKINHNFVYL